MNRKERLLDVYSDGGEWEDFEPVIDEMESEITTLRAQLAEARDGLEKIAYLEDCNISGSEYRIGVADGCRTSATIARRYLDELNKVTTA